MRGRASFDGLAASILARNERVRVEGLSIVQEFATNGEADMKEIITSSTTDTGFAREAAGQGVPGRIDSKDMIGDVSAEAGGNGSDFIGRFGWLKGFEAYYLLQENGTTRIAAMNALHGSYIRNREAAIARIHAIARG